MHKTPVHQAILKVLSAQPGVPVADTDIFSQAGLPPALGIRALYELREESTPMIERVELGDGVTASKFIADTNLLELEAGSSAVEPSSSSVKASPVLSVVPRPVSVQQASVEAAPSSQAASLPVSREKVEVNGFIFGKSKLADDILREMRTTAVQATDLMHSLEVNPEKFILAIRELEGKGLISGTPLEIGSDSDMVFTLSDDHKEEVVAALDLDFYYEDGGEDVSSGSSNASDAGSEVSSGSDDSGEASEDNASKLGAVAIREQRQRKASIDRIIHLLQQNGRMKKSELTDKVIGLYTIKGLKDLFVDLVADGTLIESRDGRMIFMELGSAESGSSSIQNGPSVDKDSGSSIARSAEESAVHKSPEVLRTDRSLSSPVGTIVGEREKVSDADPAMPEFAVTDMLMKLADRVRQLEAENNVYRKLFAQLRLPEEFKP